MTQLILNVPDKELDFFMTLVKKNKYQLVTKSGSNNDFVLSSKQIELLDKRRKTPIDKCLTSTESLKQLKKKYGI